MKTTLLAVVAILGLSACATTDTAEQQPKKIDPRQGDEVNRVCLNRNSNGWSALPDEKKSLIVYDSRHNSFKLDMIGTCDTQWAMLRIATISRTASSCLSRGDKVVTDADMNRYDSCTIMKIYKWRPELDPAKASDDAASKQPETKAEIEPEVAAEH